MAAKPRAMRSSKILLLIPVSLLLAGCHFSSLSLEYSRGKKAQDSKDYKAAIRHYNRVITREPESRQALESARQAARIAVFDTKNFSEALMFYNHLILYSPVSSERLDAQKRIAAIYFENLTDYKNAIIEYNKLLSLKNSDTDVIDFKLRVAKSYFYLNNFYQAQTEVESALKLAGESPQRFDLMLFLGNVYYNTKRTDDAVKIYQELIQKFPNRAKAENVAMNIVVCYEEREQFEKAIEELMVIREEYPNPEFIDLKIDRLRERKANLPGSRGLRK
jgi:tetratricopeptide (TPR) repeat protein